MTAQTITITVSDADVRYDSEMPVPEVVFWLEVVRSMLMKKVLEDTH